MTSEGSCNSHSNGFIMNQSNTAADAFLATTTTKKKKADRSPEQLHFYV